MDGRATKLSHVFRLLLGLGVLSTVMGLLLAGIAIPAVGALGSAANGGVKFFNDLPEDLAITPLAQQSKILDADGGLIANPYEENRIVVSLNQISANMRNAQIAIEDSRFYQHAGLDPRGFLRAMYSNISGGQVQGASTLTQQYVKITLQENALRRDDKEAAKAAVEKSYSRKLQELKYALNVEKTLTKNQILAGYLNLVYYGDQAYGVEAAARNYFGIPAAKLTLGQAALLAGIVQQPTAYNPRLHPKEAQARRDTVLSRMQELGMAKAADVAAAKKVPIGSMVTKRPPTQGVCHRSPEPYVCSYVLQWLEKSPQMAVLGKTATERRKAIYQGGLTIRTTLKPDVQKAAFKRITGAVSIGNKDNLGGAATVIQPGTGKVLAMVQASSFAKNQTNWNVDQKYGGGPNGYQFGSTAKPFTLVTALERRMPLNATVRVPPSSRAKPAQWTSSDFRDECSSTHWEVTNSGSTSAGGEMTLERMTKGSVNTAFATLAVRLGACSVRDAMTRMGLHQGDGRPISTPDNSPAAIILGAGTTTPMSLANAYATLAAGGIMCEPIPISSITTWKNQPVKFPTKSCKQAIQPDIAAGVTSLLKGVLTGGTGVGLWDFSRPAAGKTGTTDNNNQVWFAGYTRQASIAVWVGNVVLAPKGRPNDLYTLNYKCYGPAFGCLGKVFGATIPGRVWAQIMHAATDGLPVEDFPRPSEAVRNGDTVPLPWVAGRSVSDAKRILAEAGFESYVAGEVDSRVGAGLVAYTDPQGRAARGIAIAIYVSTGKAPATRTIRPTTGTTSKPGATKTPRTKPTKPPRRP